MSFSYDINTAQGVEKKASELSTKWRLLQDQRKALHFASQCTVCHCLMCICMVFCGGEEPSNQSSSKDSLDSLNRGMIVIEDSISLTPQERQCLQQIRYDEDARDAQTKEMLSFLLLGILVGAVIPFAYFYFAVWGPLGVITAGQLKIIAASALCGMLVGGGISRCGSKGRFFMNPDRLPILSGSDLVAPAAATPAF